ncbi:MAG: hypothetical protein PSY14_13055 [bacterium]|nr:hypothetical protein [bacterium]
MEATHKIGCACPYRRATAYAFAALYPPLMALMVNAPLFDFLTDTLRSEVLLLSAYFIICFAPVAGLMRYTFGKPDKSQYKRVAVKAVVYLALMLPLSAVILMFAGCMRTLCH